MSGQAGGPPDPRRGGGGGAAVGRQPGAAGARLLRGAQPQHGPQHLGGFTHNLHYLRYILSMGVLSQIFCQMGGKCIFSHFKL